MLPHVCRIPCALEPTWPAQSIVPFVIPFEEDQNELCVEWEKPSEQLNALVSLPPAIDSSRHCSGSPANDIWMCGSLPEESSETGNDSREVGLVLVCRDTWSRGSLSDTGRCSDRCGTP